MNGRPWLAYYDDGVPHHIEYPPVPLFHFLSDAARRFPDNACTIFKGARITYREMDLLTDRLAAGLAELGVRKGDRVGIFMPNTPQFVLAFFAILKAGGVVVATNTLFSAREIERQANDSGIEVMLVMSNFYELVKKVQPHTKIRTLVATNIKETLPPLLSLLFTLTKEKKGGFRIQLKKGDVWLQDLMRRHTPQERPALDITPEDIAMFQYSGGTTGVPKAVVCLHRNMVANSLQTRHWIVNADDGKETVMVAVPLFHVYGMVAGMCFAIAIAGSMVMVPNPRDLPDLLTNLQKYRVTMFPGVPTLYNAINEHPDVKAGKYNLRSIKACISGAAPLMRDTKDRFEKLTGGKLIEGYGLSEAPTATHCNPVYGENPPGSIGLPFPDVDCRIISLEDGVTELATGETGELALRGPQVMKGYHQTCADNDNALRDGWLFTGDIARRDEKGYFYIIDRKKELIKPGGFQVWPREVEEVISSHPKVLEVGVAGIPDAYRGETVKAWVVVRPQEQLSEDEIRQWCRERMAKFKVPTQVEFCRELPKTLVGKVLRRELVRQHLEKEQQKTAEIEQEFR